jgi:hypothetical protein
MRAGQLLGVIALLLITLIGVNAQDAGDYAPDPTCPTSSYWQAVTPTILAFKDTLGITLATPRAALAPLLVELRRLYREMEATPADSCAVTIRELLLIGSDEMIRALTAFLADETNYTFSRAGSAYRIASLLAPEDTNPEVVLFLADFSGFLAGRAPDAAAATQSAVILRTGTLTPTPSITPSITPTPTLTLLPTLTPKWTTTPVSITPTPGVRSFALSTAAGLVVAQGVELPGGASTFSVSSDGRVARVGVQGALYLSASWDQPGERLSFSPFSAFEPDSPEHNNARVAQAAWSPDGRLLAFLIDTDSDASPDNDSSNDGVWFLVPEVTRATDPSYQLIRDCPPEAGCSLILGAGDRLPQRRRSLYFDWNSQSSALLVSIELVDQGRRAVLVVDAVPDSAYASRQQPALLYEYASWVPDRNSVVLSGAGPDGLPVVARLDRDSGQTTVLYSAAADGRTVRSAVQTSAGRVFALTGADAAAPVVLSEISSGGARPLTEPIGPAAPVRVQWSPARDAVLLVMLEDGVRRTFVAQVNGQVEELTAQVADALAVEWVAGRLPPAAAPPASPTPTASFTASNTPTATLPPTAINAQVAITRIIDAGNLTAEGVEIRNNGPVIDLSGWTLRDAEGNAFIFPNERRLFQGGSLTVFTRVGDDTPIALYWDRRQAAYTSGEAVTLADREGRAQSIATVP